MPVSTLSPQGAIFSTDAEIPETPVEQTESLEKREPGEALFSPPRTSASKIAGNEHPTVSDSTLDSLSCMLPATDASTDRDNGQEPCLPSIQTAEMPLEATLALAAVTTDNEKSSIAPEPLDDKAVMTKPNEWTEETGQSSEALPDHVTIKLDELMVSLPTARQNAHHAEESLMIKATKQPQTKRVARKKEHSGITGSKSECVFVVPCRANWNR